MDGAPARSCITLTDSAGTAEITTIEAIGATPTGAPAGKAIAGGLQKAPFRESAG
jgi:isoquinoline 1-oxidoreductase alpha subunit